MCYFGVLVEDNYSEGKGFKFLGEVKDQLAKIYKGALSFILKQPNLEPGCYNKNFIKTFKKIMSNYETGINSDVVNEAFDKVQDLKKMAGRSASKMMQNQEMGQELLQKS